MAERVPGVVIRPTTAEDLEGFVDLYLTSAAHHAGLSERYRVPDREAVQRRFAHLLDDPDDLHLVADAGGAIVGAIDAFLETMGSRGGMRPPVSSARIGIAVLDEWRGRGVGTALMDAAEAWGRERGLEQLALDVAAENDGARRLYERLGYELVTLGLAKRLR